MPYDGLTVSTHRIVLSAGLHIPAPIPFTEPTHAVVATLAFGVCNAARADESQLSPEVQIMLRRLEAAEKQISDLKDELNETKATQQQLSDNQSQLSQSQLRMYEISAEALSAEAAKPAGQDLTMKASWKNGLELQTADKQFRIHIGGRTQLDASWYSVDDQIDANSGAAPGTSNRYEDGVDFRRARLSVDGDMYEQMEFAVEYDFINSARVRNSAGTGTTDFDLTGFTDVWWQFNELPGLGHVRIGNQKEPIGFEHLVSSRFLPFMERSYNQDTFYGGSFNGFTPGISAFDNFGEDDNGSWHVGVYKPTDNVFASNANNGDYAVTGRLTQLLWYECEGSELLHVGISGRQFSTVGDRIRYRTRDAVRAGISQQWPLPADTGNLFGDTGQWVNLETAAVHGSWTFQAEYLASFIQEAGLTAATATNDLFYQGGYVQVMYFLTGEHDNYSKSKAAFDRVKPNRNFRWMRNDCDCNTGWGAWQVGVRYNYLDLNDSGINGGELNNYTAGINWFLNPNMKIQANYILTDRNAATGGADGNIHGWGFRLAHDF